MSVSVLQAGLKLNSVQPAGPLLEHSRRPNIRQRGDAWVAIKMIEKFLND